MRRKTWLSVGSVARFALIASGLLALFLALGRILYPHDVGQYEADVWAPADAIAHGHTPYDISAGTSPPYVVASYGPLYYGLIAIGVKLFGDQFVVGRALALACLIVSALCVFLILKRYAGKTSPFIPIFGVGLLLAQYPVQAVAGIQAPDMVGLALALGGLALVFLERETRGRGQLGRAALAGFLLAAAILVRQPLFLPLLVAFSWYALHRDGRRMLVLSLAVGVTAVASFAFLQATSHGGFLWHAVRLQGSVSLSLAQARQLTFTYLRSPATIVSLLLLVIGMLRCAVRDPRTENDAAALEERLLRRLMLAYLVAAVAVAAVTSAKLGASINYWLEVSAVLSILVPLYVRPALDMSATPDLRRRAHLWSSDWLYLVLVTLTFASALLNGGREVHGLVLQWRALPYVDEVVGDIRKLTAPGELVYVEYPDLAVSAGRPYVFNDVALYEDSSRLSGIYDRVLTSNSLRLIVSLAPTPPRGYKPVCLIHAPPTGVYDVRIYYRTSGQSSSGRNCVKA